jgi:uncharacterized protein
VEMIRVLLFVAVVAAVYLLAGEICLMECLMRFRGGERRGLLARAWVRRTILLIAAIGIVCMIYGRFVEPRWLEVTHMTIPTSKMPTVGRPIRAVLISDIHSQDAPLLEPRLPEIIAAQRPDLIFYTGDSANTAEGVTIFRRLMQSLTAIAPVYAVQGNWDVARWDSHRLFDGTGVQELVMGHPFRIDIQGTSVWLAGAPYLQLDSVEQLITGIPPNQLTIVLYHSPDLVESIVPGTVDLYVAGHTHGGQVALPLYGALITFSKFDKKYEAGLYHVGETWMYVNRGIGMEGGYTPNVRFCARPEVTVLDIVGKGEKRP